MPNVYVYFASDSAARSSANENERQAQKGGKSGKFKISAKLEPYEMRRIPTADARNVYKAS